MAPFYAKLGPDRQWIRVVGQLLQKNEVRPHLIYHQFRVGRSKGLLDHYPELVILVCHPYFNYAHRGLKSNNYLFVNRKMN